jgi:rhodanese-related sulfurtransferase
MYVIDLRTPREFESGHLKNAVNVQMEDILEYFENIIDPPSFDTIAILSSDGQEAMFTVTLLQILGYHNVYGVKTGMAWHSRFADKYWLSHLSSAYQDSLSTGPSPVRREYPFAIIESADTDAYQLIRTRVKDLLSKGISSYYAGAKEAFENPDKYYIVNYWPPEEYAIGHIPGSFQYTPRQSLGRSSGLHTLPPDKPILVYCHMGNLSASAVAYLRLLGYDAWSIPFGTHSFMYDVLKEKLGRNYFDKSMVFDYPLQDKNSSGNGKSDIPKLVPVKSQGGC